MTKASNSKPVYKNEPRIGIQGACTNRRQQQSNLQALNIIHQQIQAKGAS